MTASKSIDSLSLLLRGTGTVFSGLAIRAAVTFLTEVLAARHLGPPNYGLLAWAISVLSISSMLTGLGLNTAARRFVPMYQQRQDPAALRGTLLFISGLSAASAAIGMVVLLLGARALSFQVLGDANELPILKVFAYALPFWNLQKVFLASAAGFKRPRIKVGVEDVFVPIGFLSVVLGAWSFGYGARGIAGGYAAVYLLSALFAGWAIWFRTPARHAGHVRPHYPAKEILRFSWPLAFTETISKPTGVIDMLIIGMLALPADVGIYRVASDLSVTLSFVLLCFGFLYLPVASEYFDRNDLAGWKRFNARVARWTMLAGFPVFAILFFRSDQVLRILYGNEFLSAEPLLRVLVVAHFCNAMVGVTGANLVVSKDTRWQLMVHLISLSVKIVGCVVLVPIYGVYGAAWAALASLLTMNAVSLTITTIRYDIHPFSYPYARALGTLLIGGAGLSYITAWFDSGDVTAVIVYALALGALGLVLLRSHLLIDQEDREVFSAVLKSGAKTPE